MNTTKRTGKCINFGNCAKADRKELIELDFTEDFVCPEPGCGKELVEETLPPPPLPPWLIIAIVVAVLVVGGGAAYFLIGRTPAIAQLELSTSQLELTVGDTETLTYFAEPAEAPTEELVWNSSDEAIATVNNGTVTAVASGNVQITLSTPSQKVSAQCAVIVNEPVSPPPPDGDDVSFALNEGHVVDNGTGTGTISTPFGKYQGDLKDGKANGNGTFQFFKSCRISRRDSDGRIGETGDYLLGQFENNEVVNVNWLDKDKNQKGVVMIGSLGIPPTPKKPAPEKPK